MRNLLALTTSCFVASVGLRAHAEPAATATASAELVELAWTEADASKTRIALAMPPEKSCAEVEVMREHRRTQVAICRDGGAGEPPILRFNVERSDSDGQKRTMKLRAQARMRRGTPAVIGRFEPGEGPVELTAMLR